MTKPVDEESQYALIRVGSEKYAIDIMRVKEILRPLKVTAVKRTFKFVEGVIDLRGEVIPVVDLRKRLGAGEESDAEVTGGEFESRFSRSRTKAVPGAVRKKERIVVVGWDEGKLGLMVDEASEVFRLPADRIQPPPPSAAGEDPLYAGIVPFAGDLIMVLDLDHLFSKHERGELEASELKE
ncbi:MAG: chemotaxis protein CheW [Nitrospirae bacterium]|nr:chemotaxis protein CheW [Nitrospirota bacterium]